MRVGAHRVRAPSPSNQVLVEGPGCRPPGSQRLPLRARRRGSLLQGYDADSPPSAMLGTGRPMVTAARRVDSPSRTALQRGSRERPSSASTPKEGLVPYDRIIGRDDAGALIPLEQTSEFFSATGPGVGGARVSAVARHEHQAVRAGCIHVGGSPGIRSAIARRPSVSSLRSSASSAARPSREMCRAASSAMAQRLWLTTSTLCPSGSRTNAP